MPHITIIEAGPVGAKYREEHGSYPNMFERMIGAADSSATFATVNVFAGEKLPDADTCEAILITGSAAGVYDPFDWIAPLEDFVRKAHAAKVPMVGVCFGHQLIAQALGGVARKSEKGWGIGRHVYDVAAGNGLLDGAQIALAASHQDQVITPPPGATTIMSSDFAEHAGLLYAGGTTLSVQPHPEFTVGYALVCCEIVQSRGTAPESLVTSAKESLTQPLEGAKLGHAITRFLTAAR